MIGVALAGLGCRAPAGGCTCVAAAIVTAAARDVDLATDDRLDAARGGVMVELLGREQIAMIGDGYGRHAAARRFAHQFLNVAGAVEQAVVRVQMQVNEARSAHAGEL